MVSKIKSQHNDEIDLLDAYLILLNNKLKFFLVAFLTVIIIVGIQNLTNNKSKYLATTEITPISTFDEFEYNTYNLYFKKWEQFYEVKNGFENLLPEGVTLTDKITQIEKEKKRYSFKNIERSYLLNLFIDKINDNTLFKNGIRKFGLVKKEDYGDDQAYEDAVTRLASRINLLPPNNDSEKGPIVPNWRIQFETENIERWQNFLKYIEGPANNEIQSFITETFIQFIINEKNINEFDIEDVETKINTAVDNYKTMIKRRLLYLTEQAKIARTLSIAKNNILESQSFRTDTAVITTLISEIPYYMRGYEMIEKEIELIKSREDPKAFIPDLDELENQMRNLISNKDLERLESLFNQTPILKSDNFYAAKIMFQSTIHENLNDKNQIKTLILASLIGIIIAIFYVLISNAVHNRR